MKKLTSTLLALVMLLCLMPISASAAETTIKDALLYKVGDTVGYNVVHEAPLAKSAEISGSASVQDLNREAEEKAVTADLTLDHAGNVEKIQVASVKERPVIGITYRLYAVDKSFQNIAEAFRRNGANPQFISMVATKERAEAVLNGLDGIFFAGGEDINPLRYGELPEMNGSQFWNDVRDTSDIALMQEAIALDKPLFAVCRGSQVMNVALGGGLIQDIPTYLGKKVEDGEISAGRVTGLAGGPISLTDHHRRVYVDGLIHNGGTKYKENVKVLPGSKWLEGIVGGTNIPIAATAHHQAVDSERLGTGLTVVAMTSDGIVEGLEHQGSKFALAVQFHPERDALGDSSSIDVDNDLCNRFLRALVVAAEK